jgi:hypothetical protein
MSGVDKTQIVVVNDFKRMGVRGPVCVGETLQGG